MRWFAVALVLVGCTEEDLALQEIVASDEPLDEVAERTRISWIGEARLTPDGPPIDPDRERSEAWSREIVPVVEIGERLRIVAKEPYVRLLLWLDPEDLGTWIIDDARAGALPGQLAGETGVFFDGGIEVEVTGRDGAWTSVAMTTREFDVEVWLPDFEVGPYWIDRERDPVALDGELWLRGGAELLNRPHGEVLATLHEWGDEENPDEPHVEAVELDRADGHVLVEIESDGVTVAGWVPEDQAADEVHVGWGMSGCGGCGGFGHGWGVYPALYLEAGTQLYSGPDGEWVGETTQARGWGYGAQVDGWTPIHVPTDWGQATLWVW